MIEMLRLFSPKSRSIPSDNSLYEYSLLDIEKLNNSTKAQLRILPDLLWEYGEAQRKYRKSRYQSTASNYYSFFRVVTKAMQEIATSERLNTQLKVCQKNYENFYCPSLDLIQLSIGPLQPSSTGTIPVYSTFLSLFHELGHAIHYYDSAQSRTLLSTKKFRLPSWIHVGHQEYVAQIIQKKLEYSSLLFLKSQMSEALWESFVCERELYYKYKRNIANLNISVCLWLSYFVLKYKTQPSELISLFKKTFHVNEGLIDFMSAFVFPNFFGEQRLILEFISQMPNELLGQATFNEYLLFNTQLTIKSLLNEQL